MMRVERWELVIRRDTQEVARVRADLDCEDGAILRAHLLAALLRNGDRERDIGAYVMDVHRPGQEPPEFRYVAL